MGLNTVAVLYNDHTDRIRDDGPLGQRIASAMMGWTSRSQDRSITHFGAGMVVSQAHADYSQVVVVGRNSGRMLEECDDLDWYALNQIEGALRRHGYTVQKPKTAKKLPTPSP
jgi:hypothetical protein